MLETLSTHKKDKEDLGVKRYNLVLPMSLFIQLRDVADADGESIVTILKQFIRLGLMVVEISKNNPNVEIVIRDGDDEKSIIPMW